MALLLRLVEAAERDPKEREALHRVLIRVASALQALAGVTARLGHVGGEVEAAVARGVHRSGEAMRGG